MPKKGNRYCCVFNFHKNDRVIKQWTSSTCEKHKFMNGTSGCDYTFPFFLSTFPAKDKALRDEHVK